MTAKRTAFVTGSTGFLGINLLQELDREGWDILAFHRPTSDLKELKKLASVRYAVGDVTDAASVLAAMPEGVDAVFNAAGAVGFFDPSQDAMQYRVNVEGTRHVVQAALARRCGRFIQSSTILAYDIAGGAWVDEASPPNPSQASYIRTKLLADREVEAGIQQGLDAVILHPSAIFGAYDKATWSQMFKELHHGPGVPACPPGGCSANHMRAVVKAHVAAYHKGGRGEHYVLGGPHHSFREIVDAIAALLGKEGPRFTPPPWLFRTLCALDRGTAPLRGRKPMVSKAEAEILCMTGRSKGEKAMRELGYQPASLQVMLEDCYQWMLAEGMLDEPANK